MKGLLLKDFYMMKKNLVIIIFLSLYFLAVLLVGSDSSSNNSINIVVYALCFFLPCIFTSCAMFIIDENPYSIATLYTHSLPVSSKFFITEKYIVTHILFLASYVIIFLQALLNVIINSYTIKGEVIYIGFLISSVVFIYINLEIPLIIKFGQAIAAALIVAFIVLLLIVGICILVKANTTLDVGKIKDFFMDNRLLLICIAVIADFLSLALSFKLSKKVSEIR